MGRAPCCSKVGLHRGPWTPREDTLLVNYIQAHGEGHWRSLPKNAGLLRCGKSCRLRWMNYLRPDIKRGNITPDEDDLIIRLHSLLGNRWSLIAGRLPGRTDNEIKNYWNTYLSKRLVTQETHQYPNSTHKKPSKPVVQKKRKKNSKAKPILEPSAEIPKVKKNSKAKPILEPSAEIPKVYLPKPIRVTSFSLPRNHTFDQCNTFSTGFRSACNNEDDHDLVANCSGLECHSHVPASGDDKYSLEKIYQEYMQLLKTNEDQVQLDSFAESLLI